MLVRYDYLVREKTKCILKSFSHHRKDSLTQRVKDGKKKIKQSKIKKKQ